MKEGARPPPGTGRRRVVLGGRPLAVVRETEAPSRSSGRGAARRPRRPVRRLPLLAGDGGGLRRLGPPAAGRGDPTTWVTRARAAPAPWRGPTGGGRRRLGQEKRPTCGEFKEKLTSLRAVMAFIDIGDAFLVRRDSGYFGVLPTWPPSS